MHVLLTGGAGFIGSHVAEALLARGDRVTCLDNLDDYYDPSLKLANLAELAVHSAFSFQRVDIRNAERLHGIALENDFDAVVHLAARAGVRPSIEQAALYTDVNVTGTVRLLELAREFRIGRFVLASSSSVYGERREVPFRETDPVDTPLSPYAATKRAGELLCATYQALHGMAVSCLRFFTVYGPRQRPEMAIARFAACLENDEPIPLYAGGAARRDYTYVADIADGVLRALDRAVGYRIYNLGNEQMVTTRALVETLADLLGTHPRLALLPAQPGDVSTTCADLTRARTELGFAPRTALTDGLAHYLAWRRQTAGALTH